MCFGVLTGSAAHPTPFSAFHLPAYTTLSPSTCAIAPRSLRFLSCLQLCFCFVDFCCKPVAWPVLVVVVFYVSHCCCSSPVYVFSSLTSSGCIALALQSSLFGNVFNSLCRYHRGRSCSRRWRWRCFFSSLLKHIVAVAHDLQLPARHTQPWRHNRRAFTLCLCFVIFCNALLLLLPSLQLLVALVWLIAFRWLGEALLRVSKELHRVQRRR